MFKCLHETSMHFIHKGCGFGHQYDLCKTKVLSLSGLCDIIKI